MATEQPIETKPLDQKLTADKSADPVTSDNVPETTTLSDIPGGFPVTPANDLDTFVSVNPLPASEGGVNPIKLEPGEKIPESITTQSTDKYVKLDKESYEKSDALPGVETELPPVSSNSIPESSLPVTSFQDATLSSITPTGTTAALVADIPLEPKASEDPVVPQVVKESQEKAHASPEASAVTEEVREKALVEEELKEKVPEAPTTSVGTASQDAGKTEASDSSLAALAATAGGAFIAAGLTAKEVIDEKTAPIINDATDALTDSANKNLPDSVKEQLPVAAQEALATKNREQITEQVSSDVPVEVKESLIEAGKSPEAAANTEAVDDKKAVEAELLREVKPATGVHEAVATQTPEENKQVSPEVPIEVKESIAESGTSPEATTNTDAVEEKKVVEAELLKEVTPAAAINDNNTGTVSDAVPAEVKESIVESGKGPEAAANTEAVHDKKEVEAELLKEVEPAAAIESTQSQTAAPEVPPEVRESIVESGKGPEAAASTEAVQDKKNVEAELLQEVEPAAAVTAPVIESAKTEEPTTETTNTSALPIIQSQEDKTEAPKVEETKPEETKPEETKTEETKTEVPRVEEPNTETKSETPVATGNGTVATENGSKARASTSSAANGNGNSSTKEHKKKNRLSSIFSKIKHKLSDK